MLFKEVIDESQLQVKVELVHDGIKLMELLNKAVEEDSEQPNAQFLDLNMPLKNGYHQGYIFANSDLNKGNTFSIYFPD